MADQEPGILIFIYIWQNKSQDSLYLFINTVLFTWIKKSNTGLKRLHWCLQVLQISGLRQWFSRHWTRGTPSITSVKWVALDFKNWLIYYSAHLLAERLGSGVGDCVQALTSLRQHLFTQLSDYLLTPRHHSKNLVAPQGALTLVENQWSTG